jgi:aspartyl-tRNA(Asn)/glutamyl-tRNA(Gln) amidotransferase subunit B
MGWSAVIGLEVHVQLKTKSKIFSGSSTSYGALPNTQACAIDLGLPGVLPVLNEEAVIMALRFGLAINAKIARHSYFDRKNYFYPDLPKGYQTTQQAHPIVGEGLMEIDLPDRSFTIRIERAHLEEDAGKSLHEDFHSYTGIDLNRAGTPLLEIVSAPDMRSATEAVAYLKTLHNLVCYLEICDGNMQEGSFRCDANISVRKNETDPLGTRCEIKNINSFKFVEKAINFEIERQIDVLESGGKIIQQTRLYDPDKDETRPMRDKEEANDYRYFPEPDILAVVLSDSMIDNVRKNLPELPKEKLARFSKDYGLSNYDAGVLTSTRALAYYYETVITEITKNTEKNKEKYKEAAKLAANWVMGELLAALNKENIEITNSPISSSQLALLVSRLLDQTISGKTAKQLFEGLWLGECEGLVDAIINKRGLRQVTDSSAIEKIIDEVMAANPGQLNDYRSGKDKLFGFFVGQVMKISKGVANPQQVNDLLKEKLQG